MPRARIESVDFLTIDECGTVERVVRRLEPLWEPRRKSGSEGTITHPFYTLGVASYIDAVTHDKDTNYFGRARELNSVLRAELSFLYDKLTATLSGCLGGPVSFASGLALPGFHIFPTERGVHYPEVELHLDLQYKYIPWERPEEIDFRNPVSFTVPISLPDEGGGLNVCDLTAASIMLLGDEERGSALDHKIRYIPYEMGRMMIQRGLLLHGVAKRRNINSQTDRITFQGHAVLRRDTWQLYW